MYPTCSRTCRLSTCHLTKTDTFTLVLYSYQHLGQWSLCIREGRPWLVRTQLHGVKQVIQTELPLFRFMKHIIPLRIVLYQQPGLDSKHQAWEYRLGTEDRIFKEATHFHLIIHTSRITDTGQASKMAMEFSRQCHT